MQSYDSFLKKVLFTILQGVKNIVFFVDVVSQSFSSFSAVVAAEVEILQHLDRTQRVAVSELLYPEASAA